MIKFSQKNVEKIDILNLIDDETLAIEVSLTFQKKLNEQVLSYLRAFMDENPFTNDSDNMNIMSDYLGNTSKILKKSSANLVKFQALQAKLFSMRKTIDDLKQPSLNFVKTQFDDYNKKYAETIEKSTPLTIEIQTFLAQCQQDDILKELLLEREISKKAKLQEKVLEEVKVINNNNNVESQNTTSTNDDYSENIDLDIYPELSSRDSDDDSNEESIHEVQEENVEEIIEETPEIEISDSQDNINSNEIEEIKQEISENKSTNSENIDNIKLAEPPANIVENTLIISEKNGNVVLPYTFEELNTVLAKNPFKYDDIEDVIAKKYTKPMKYYKNSSIARFKETFKLVRERGNGSLKHAWDLSLEAFFNYDLHPAIISACKSIDELDIYLSCLEYDELEDFRFFKIIFDVLPTLSKKKKSTI